MLYSEIIERVISGVVKDNPNPPPLDRLRMAAETHFPHVLSQVAEAFAAREDRRLLMKQNVTLTFTAGTATLPDKVLRKYLKDATLIVTVNTGQAKQYYSYVESYSLFQMCKDSNRTPDNRLGYWAVIANTIEAVTPSTQTPLTSSAVASIILDAPCSPDVPATASTEFDGPADFEPELINALIETLRGATVSAAAEAA